MAEQVYTDLPEGSPQLLSAENEALRQTLLACQRKLRLTEERSQRAEELLQSESSARKAVEETLLSLERVREQGDSVVKVEMEMRKDLGRDLETAMETVSQLEKQLSAVTTAQGVKVTQPPLGIFHS